MLMTPVVASFLHIFVLFAFSGLFSLATEAVKTVRESVLKEKAEEGEARSLRLLKLLERREELRAVLHFGRVLFATVAAVEAGYHFAPALERVFIDRGLAGDPAASISFALVAAILTLYGSFQNHFLARGVAHAYPSFILKILLPFLSLGTMLFAPLVRGFSRTVEYIVGHLPLRRGEGPEETEEEIKTLIEQGAESGVFNEHEEMLFTKALRFGHKNAEALMTSRQDLVWVAREDTPHKMWSKISESGYSCFPVTDGSIDTIVGITTIKDIAQHILDEKSRLDDSSIRDPLKIPSTMSATDVLERFKDEKKQFALVLDEYGGVDGVLTVHNLMEALVGELNDGASYEEAAILQRHDGSYLVDSTVDLDELMDRLDVKEEDRPEHKGYHSVGGLVMGSLGHVPTERECFDFQGFRFEVVDMDGRRIDKVLISPLSLADLKVGKG